MGEPAVQPPGLSALRRTLLAELREPASASDLARRLELTRQKVNYHLRELERLGLIEQVGERRRRGFTDRQLQAVDRDRHSSGHLLAAVSRTAEDVAVLRERARAAGKPIATLTIETEIAFATPGDFQGFARELAGAVERLAARYHRPDEPRARRHRVLAGAHPVITRPDPEEPA